MRSRYVFILGVVLLGIAALVWRLLPPNVPVVAAYEGPAVQAVYATGSVEPTIMLPIAPRIAARIAKLEVDEGAKVEEGTILATLDDAEYRANLIELKAQEQRAKQEFERVARLIERRAVSQDELDRTRATFQAAQAARQAAEARVNYFQLIAPSAGEVIRRDGEVGELIPINQPIFWLAGNAPLRVSAEVDEEDIASVQIGQKALLRADAFPDQTFHGTVHAITPKGDPVARSYRVRIHLDGETPFRIGMTAETNIIVNETQNAILVPTSAVEGNSVWVVKDGHATRRKVEIGARGSAETQIRQGLERGELVVIDNFSALTDGMRVWQRVKEHR